MADEINNNHNGAGESGAPAANGAGEQELKDKLAAAEKQRDEYLAGWQRAKADFINYKNDEMKRLEEVAQYGAQGLIRDLISVLDNFDLGLRALEKNGPVEKGVYLIRTQIEDILKKRGLTKIDIKVGDTFDPSVAEALSEVPSDKPPGSIVEVIEQGYRLHEKVLRPARVIVSKEK
ncbi:MAG TPA: nucleotide exchange factor GrpE [Candidatus Paceibacterota bacterium]|nr:nucleotide exchange factor GrpE [Candidatus Paceibacterota bacterium]